MTLENCFHLTELSISDFIFLQVYSSEGLVYLIIPRRSPEGHQRVSDNDFGEFFSIWLNSEYQILYSCKFTAQKV